MSIVLGLFLGSVSDGLVEIKRVIRANYRSSVLQVGVVDGVGGLELGFQVESDRKVVRVPELEHQRLANYVWKRDVEGVFTLPLKPGLAFLELADGKVFL